MLTRALAMLALVGAAAATGVFVGRADQDPDAGWARGYRAGIRAERNAQEHDAETIAARYRPGSAGFEAIYAAGRREGRRLGRYEGLAEGRRAGFKAGKASVRKTSVLPDFPGGWRAQHWYVVRVDQNGKRQRIGARVVVARGQQYGPCRADADRICATPQL